MMKIRNRIALFVGQADEEYQSRFITGFLRMAFAADFDVCIFSMYRKYQDTTEREQGESNIFLLMNPEMFEGAVILKDSIQTANVAQDLELRLKQVFQKPIVVIEKESDLFPSICTDCYAAVFELVSHLIEKHGCRDIAYLSGKKWHKHSKERLQAFRDAMKAHDLPLSEERIIYGDFWYQSGEMCAEHLLSQNTKLPEAVACANDQMAIGLCKAFQERGIRVPEDILVIGYDSTYEGQTSPKSMTSAWIPAEEFGEYAFHFLTSEMEGKVPESFKLKPHLVFGESCGCRESGMHFQQVKRRKWETEISEEGYSSVFNSMDENLLSQSALSEFLGTVYSYVYQLRDAGEFHLCIGSNWKYMGQSVHQPHGGYPERMIHAVRYCKDHKHSIVGLDYTFLSADMLPELKEAHEKPSAYIFTPVFYEKECFGYAALIYDTPRSYDETYRRWIASVSRGLEVLRRSLEMKHMQEQLERIRNNKFSISNNVYEGLNADDKAEYQLVSRILDENLLDYHFQPIVRVFDGEIFAYEALMRSKTEKRVSPLSIIKYAAMQDRLQDIEKATFLNVLRIIDERYAEFGMARIFINSIPGVRIIDEDFEKTTRYLQKYARKVVVELTEEAELNDDELARLKAYFAELHIDIAVDDYGTGYSNVSNLLRYMPNYVKIDRSLISEIQNQPRKMHFVREIIEFCHDNHVLALAEGVETAEELQTVIHLGVDLVQGFYTGRPAAEIVTSINDKLRNEIRQFYQERIDGIIKRIYIAGKTNRISLSKLMKDGCTDIIVGRDKMVYSDVAVIGTPQMKTDMHLRVESGYCGRITLEDVYFSNVKNRPCIELCEHTDVTLVLRGNNTLFNYGIQVPESSRLVVEGDGTLTIDLNSAEYYGIGNSLTANHGELHFVQNGSININARGKSGVCIGSGKGGTIRIDSGEYNLRASTECCVGIGAMDGAVSLKLKKCHIETEFSVTSGLVLGSLENDADVTMTSSALNYYGDGKYMTGIGTLHGKKSSVSFKESSVECNISADHSTCLGALEGETDIHVEYTSLKLKNAGLEAIIFGGFDDRTKIRITNSDTQVSVRSSIGKDTFAKDEDFIMINGRRRIMINGMEYERTLRFDYS